MTRRSTRLTVWIVAPVALATCWLFRPDALRYADEFRAGQQAIAAIERYHSRTGSLPDSLADVGLPAGEDGPVYYASEDRQDYILWFGTTLGESITYHSRTRQWDSRWTPRFGL
jgi:hypothetical protein